MRTVERFPRDVFASLGTAGLLGPPFSEDVGGGGQPYEVYLQVFEELAQRWASVAMGVSVHTLTCFPIDQFGSADQRTELLPSMVGGDMVGAYCMSEAHAGSDPAAMRASAHPDGDDWRASGSKSWVTHGGHADYYTTFLRTSDERSRGISCFHLDAGLPPRRGPRGSRLMPGGVSRRRHAAVRRPG